MNTLLSLAATGLLALSGTVLAGTTKTYQVTGPILEMNDSMIAVQKGKDRWEIAKEASTKATGEMKVGDKVTITYTMTATEIESKAAAPKKSKDAASKPAASPVKK